MSTFHSKKAAEFIQDTERTEWHDQALWHVRAKRDIEAHNLPEWENLRELGSKIKRHTLTNLDTYLEKFEKNLESNGVIVHWASDATEFNQIVESILAAKKAKKLVKSKSMLTEECEMLPYLEKSGYDVVESDLGERILQLLKSPPSHIVLPAIHVKRQEVGTLFEEKMDSEKGNDDPTYLTHQARLMLRNDFLTGDVAMTGVNFGVAETGSFVVCTNEGNADLGTSFPKTHIAVMGIEKLVPDNKSLAVYTRLLARAATGQPITTYTSHYKKPIEGQEMHMIIVDNGRSKSLANQKHNNTLKCIRCGSCMNTCPVYRRSGGFTYNYFIPGPIGINLGMLKSPEKYKGNLSACSLCLSCSNVCPVKIDLGEQIYDWRQEASRSGLANPEKKMIVKSLKFVMDHEWIFKMGLKGAKLVRFMPRFLTYNKLNAWGLGRENPDFAKETFEEMWKKGKVSKKK